MRSNGRSIQLIGAILCGVLALTIGAGPAAATHSLPQPWLWYWDTNNDGYADPAVSVDAAGGGWTSLALSRLSGGIGEWAGDTRFDPFT